MAKPQPELKADDFHLGAHVFASDGKEVGELVHVLVDGDYKLKSLIVKEDHGFSGHWLSPGSMLVNDELIVPLDAIKDVDHDRFDLNLSSGDARRRRRPRALVGHGRRAGVRVGVAARRRKRGQQKTG